MVRSLRLRYALRHALSVVALGSLAGPMALGACSAGAGPASESVGSTAAAITTSDILSRADQWVTAKLLYCQSPNGADDSIDPSCPSTCVREHNSAWDPYRSDCSGFIAWAWNLPAPGRTTDELAPADTTVSYAINGSDLQPGDALNLPGDHVVLFVSWQTVGSVANFYEEPGCSATPNYAHAFTSNVTITGQSVYVDYEGLTFTAIRYTGVTSGGGTTPPGVDAGVPCTIGTGESGTCELTSDCASMGGVSTAGYCPGADDIQCCTGVPTPPPMTLDAGVAASSAASTVTTQTSLASSAPFVPSTDAGGVPPPPPAGGTSTGVTSQPVGASLASSGAPPAVGGGESAGAGAGAPPAPPGESSSSSDDGFAQPNLGGCAIAPAGRSGVDGGLWLAAAALGLTVGKRRRRA